MVGSPPQWRPRCAGSGHPLTQYGRTLQGLPFTLGQELGKAIVEGPIIIVFQAHRSRSLSCRKRHRVIARPLATCGRMPCNTSAASRRRCSIRPEPPRRGPPLRAAPSPEGRRRSAPRPRNRIGDTTAPVCHDWSRVHHPRSASSGVAARARMRSYARQKGQYLSTARMIRAYRLAGHRRRATHSGQTEQILASSCSIR